MVDIKHASDSVKSESIKLVLIHPEAQVAQQEPHHLMMAIVEESAVPLIMATLAAAVEVLVISAIKLVETIEHVLGCMAVDDIKEYDNTHAVRSVNELLEVLRRAISTARREEVVDLIAKTGVVGMLHDSHQLDHIVAKILDPGEHILGELLVGCNPLLGAGDTNMGLVHTSAFGLLGSRMLELVRLGGGGVPEAGVIGGRHGQVLCHVLDPCGESIGTLAIGQSEGDLGAVSVYGTGQLTID